MSKEAQRKELDYVIIRRYTPDDYSALEELHSESWPKLSTTSEDSKSDTVSPRRAEAVFVAENSGEVVGSIFYTPRLVHAYLHSLVVKEACRRQGIAAELLKVAEEQANRDGFARITIIAGSDELIRYYENLGFRRNPPIENGLGKEISAK